MNDHSPMVAGVQSIAKVATPQAGRSLQPFAKPFQPTRLAIFTERSGHITFSVDECRLDADAGMLRLSLTARAVAQMEQLQDIVVRHLLRLSRGHADRLAPSLISNLRISDIPSTSGTYKGTYNG